jgi:hypothetical protein
MNNLWISIAIIAGSEVVAIGIFAAVARFGKSTRYFHGRSILKGILERGFIVFSLLSGYPQALTLFAALKIGTRIKDENPVSNDFYLVGNLISVSLAIFYTMLLQHLLNL